MVDEEAVRSVLRDVYDPEIGINVLDLGLVYRMEVVGDSVDIDMTMTYPGCPASGMIAEQAEAAIGSIPGVKNVHIELVWDPPWTPEKMTEDIRRALGFPV